ncbi:MAG: twin-arginine translocation signal domain-containing protein, partial [Lentisphaeraceae bacterium]|nr:twin-arginine translocation signal domain-containing protein [Lentisphaeraceae bacterium]
MDQSINRRKFVKAGAAVSALGTFVNTTFGQNKANNTLNVALIGCGGRGRGAAANSLNADPNVKLVAIADVFPERLNIAVKSLKNYG